jgi:hypothetical protein
MSDLRWLRLAPIIVGWLLVVESVMMFAVVYFFSVLGALLAGGFDAFTSDNATEEEVKEGFRRIMLTIVAPILLGSDIALAGVLVLVRRQPMLAVAACIVAVLAQIAFHVFVVDGFHWSSLLPAFLHVAAIGVLLLAPRRG